MARQRLKDSIQQLLPEGETVDEAFLVSEQPSWLNPLLAVVWFVPVVFIFLQSGSGSGIAIATGLFILMKNLFAKPLGLARAGSNIYLTTVSFWNAKAKSLDAKYPLGTPATQRAGIMNDRYSVLLQHEGESFLTPRWHRSRMAEMFSLS